MSNQRGSRAIESGVLHVVATPIGNLNDISKRAVDVLADAALIAAEDTRRSLSLLRALGLPRPQMLALHDHNEDSASEVVIRALVEGHGVVLMSDAGTPLLSDPGYVLVRRCFDEGILVHPVPGPSAVSAALSVCPLPTGGYRFTGFLPVRSSPRRSRLSNLLEAGDPVVFFEAPHRLRNCLSDLADIAPTRRLFVAREMTKKFETYLCATPAELISRMDDADQWRGEVVCVLEGASAAHDVSQRDRLRVMQVLAAELGPAQAARIGAQLLGTRKSELYELARQLKNDD